MRFEWLLAPFVLLLPLILNVRCWRRDLERVRALVAARRKISYDDLLRHGHSRVSFLVAAWNEEATLAACIQSILNLGYPELELILCAGGTDKTFEIASQFRDSRLKLLRQNAGDGKQKSLSRCLELASGEIIYLIDADSALTPAAFVRTVAAIVIDREDAVTSTPCTPFPHQSSSAFAISQCASWSYTSLRQPKYGASLVGMNAAIRHTALKKVGGFDASVAAGGDFELGKRLRRAGFRIRYEPDASFPIEFQTNLRIYWRQQARWLRNVVIHGVSFGAYREAAMCLLTSLIGLAMLVAPFVLLAGFLLHLRRAILLTLSAIWAVGLFHALFSRIRYLKVAAEWLGIRVPANTILYTPGFLFIDFVAWAIPLFQYPWRSAREKW